MLMPVVTSMTKTKNSKYGGKFMNRFYLNLMLTRLFIIGHIKWTKLIRMKQPLFKLSTI